MILCYAPGGGLGHLTRLRAAIHTLGLHGEIAAVTASPYAGDPRVMGVLRPICIPPALDGDPPGLRSWLADLLRHLQPVLLVVDAFPAGIMGELNGLELPPTTTVIHLARLLRWERYVDLNSPRSLRFDHTYILEPLAADHAHFLSLHSLSVQPLVLSDPPVDSGRWTVGGGRWAVDGGRWTVDGGWWLIVHSGPDEEIIGLVEYARERAAYEGVKPELSLVAPQRPEGLPPDVGHINCYPATMLFAGAGKIISACGFNIMRQTEPYAAKHWFMPFPRAFDDQFARAARRRREQSKVEYTL